MNQQTLFDCTPEAPPRPVALDWPEVKRFALELLVTPMGDPIEDVPLAVMPMRVLQHCKAKPKEVPDALDELAAGGYIQRDGDLLNITDAGREALGL